MLIKRIAQYLAKRGLKRKEPMEYSGLWGEEKALIYLKSNGYKILDTRVRFGSREEIDIVARQNDQLVFVEVKTRKNEDFGRPLSAVDRDKRGLLSRAAVRYLKKLKDPHVYFRFDVVEVVGSPEGGIEPKITHIENAFQLSSKYSIFG